MVKHGHDFGLPFKTNNRGWKKTPRDLEGKNISLFKEKLVSLTKNGDQIEGTYTSNGKVTEVIHFFDPGTSLNVMYDADSRNFISAWKLAPEQIVNKL